MFKKFLNLIKSNKEESIEKTKEVIIETDDIGDVILDEKSILEEKEEIIEESVEPEVDKKEEIITIINEDIKTDEQTIIVEEYSEKIEDKNIKEISEDDKIYIKSMKIKRAKEIKAIDVYSNEEILFNTHQECSKKLGVPIEYIKENLEYGYTDYFGKAVKYLAKNLRVDIESLKSEGKNIVEIFNYLHNQLWNEGIPEERREKILSSENIEPIRMHYKFEIMDNDYDEYFKTYGRLIRRGGKKRIELVDKKNEVIEVFKSLDDCANFFKKEKSEIIDRLKCGECKIGRYEIRYSLTR